MSVKAKKKNMEVNNHKTITNTQSKNTNIHNKIRPQQQKNINRIKKN